MQELVTQTIHCLRTLYLMCYENFTWGKLFSLHMNSIRKIKENQENLDVSLVNYPKS